VALTLAISKQMELEKPNTMKEKNKNKRNNTMKRYIYLFALLTLLVIGCSEQSSVLSPNNNVNTNEPNWMALPKAEGMQVNGEVSTSKLIRGNNGGNISLNYKFRDSQSGIVTLKSDIRFPKLSFSGNVTFTITHDNLSCVAAFGPSFVFNKDLILNVKYIGIDLTGINPSTVKFAYIAADGSVQYAVNDGIVVDLSTGTLEVINAKIPHFSRYGWLR